MTFQLNRNQQVDPMTGLPLNFWEPNSLNFGMNSGYGINPYFNSNYLNFGTNPYGGIPNFGVGAGTSAYDNSFLTNTGLNFQTPDSLGINTTPGLTDPLATPGFFTDANGNFSAMQTLGTVGQGLNIAGDLASLYFGKEALDIARGEYRLNRDATIADVNARAAMINADMRQQYLNRQAMAAGTNNPNYQLSVDEYVAQNQVDTLDPNSSKYKI